MTEPNATKINNLSQDLLVALRDNYEHLAEKKIEQVRHMDKPPAEDNGLMPSYYVVALDLQQEIGFSTGFIAGLTLCLDRLISQPKPNDVTPVLYSIITKVEKLEELVRENARSMDENEDDD